ncbi:hypothetical protein [Deinococcus aquaticus]|uniref:Transposase n=1 Tax=Deinococcus aquaticus TaxID=328692 RepID=A0ABY7V0A3_9DEIO|nr:hypothetical protein [Deinococcus aquaticus]WDA57563.1 hypothetical protein M8445_09325 [Deinococcus aquaticus]
MTTTEALRPHWEKEKPARPGSARVQAQEKGVQDVLRQPGRL